MTDDKKSFLDELIEKMEAYATKVREKGFEIHSGKIKKTNPIKWHPDTGTVITPSKGYKEIIDEGYMFVTKEERRVEETDKETEELVNERFSAIFGMVEMKCRIYNPLSERMILFRLTTSEIKMYWDLIYSADVTYHGDNLLSRTQTISLKHGRFTLDVEDFSDSNSDSNIENCFKFLLGESNKVLIAGGGGCFIATAACGTPLASEVIWLSRFRDEVLSKRAMGMNFINFYYKISPPIASWISRHELAKAFIRTFVVHPLSKLSRLFTY